MTSTSSCSSCSSSSSHSPTDAAAAAHSAHTVPDHHHRHNEASPRRSRDATSTTPFYDPNGLPLTIQLPTPAASNSSCNSPTSAPPLSGLFTSRQTTPETMQSTGAATSSPVPFSLPEACVPVSTASPTPIAMADTAAPSKPPNLIRRISRGAHSRLTRQRGSGARSRRDHSAEPVIMRRRSDSRAAVADLWDLSDIDLENPDEEPVEDAADATASQENMVHGLGIAVDRPGAASLPATDGAPVRSSIVEQGFWLNKVTKKNIRLTLFRVDLASAKVVWDQSRPSKSFYIDSVREIRVGADARHYREGFQIAAEYEDRFFTIIYSDPTKTKGRFIKTLHIIAPGEEQKLEFLTTVEMCRSLQINSTEYALRGYFDQAGQSPRCLYDQFLTFMRGLKERRDLKAIFDSINGANDLCWPAFADFLRVEQGVDLSVDQEDYWHDVFKKFVAMSSTADGGGGSSSNDACPETMNLQAFQAFMTSPMNHVLASPRSEPRLNHPLNEYFISSSHNTYLLGRQVAGHSSTEAYIVALQKGCRCIEIDCWDGSDGRPNVVHGRTLTSKVLFADCISVIHKYAFVSSPYPLIISLEVHCNPGQQAAMVDIMKSQFGSQLLLEPVNDSQVLPSPEDLKHKILIKVKASEDVDDAMSLSDPPSARSRQRSFSSPFSKPISIDVGTITDSPVLSGPPSASPPERATPFWQTPRTSVTSGGASQHSSTEDSDGHVVTTSMDKKRKKKTSKIIKALGDLGVYTRGIKYSDFCGAEAKTYNHIYSFAERTFDSLCNKASPAKALLEEHNLHHLMRVYPSNFRINSSNFDPINYWRRGVQMAATNWQTYDLGQQINDAMFAAGNDRTGYVLKPQELRESRSRASVGDECKRAKQQKKLVTFSVNIISAQQLPRLNGMKPGAAISPYVEFEMYSANDKSRGAAIGDAGTDASARNGMSGIGVPLRMRTPVIDGSGYEPCFAAPLSMSIETRFPDLVFVRWTVWNSADGKAPLASFTAKLSSLQQGYRHLPLFNSNGDQYMSSTLFCRIKKGENVHIEQNMQMQHHQAEPPSPPPEVSSTSKRDFIHRLFRPPPGQKRKDREARGRDGDGDREVLAPRSRSSTPE